MSLKNDNLTITKIIDLTWKMLSEDEKISPYVIDQPTTLFDDRCKIFNMSKFNKLHSNIHTKNIKRIDGINSPYLHIGDFFTFFPLHLEDGDLCALNFLH